MGDLKKILKNLPESPGVYKMLDGGKKVIYVGKAKNLRSRTRQYFQKNYEHSTRTRKLLKNVTDIQYTETDTELEALLLENNLIKKLRPRYNILMKDDKSYVYIKIDLNEDFPRIVLIREHEMEYERRNKTNTNKTNAVRYFGPKLASSKVYETLRILKKLFPFRHCKLDIEMTDNGSQTTNNWSRAAGNELENLRVSPNKALVEVKNRIIDYPCLDYYIKRCPGPCIGAISSIEYKKIVQQIVEFLEGKSDEIEKSLKTQMLKAAKGKLFEKAARLRDKLFAIQKITERQKITDPERQNTDIINFIVETGHVYFNVFAVRNGKLINQENFILDAPEISEKDAGLDLHETLESFIAQYYEKAAEIPRELLIPEELGNKKVLEDWLTEKGTRRVKISAPQKGAKNKLLELSFKNAVSFAAQYRVKWLAYQRGETALKRLAEILKLEDKNALKRIEGFDISHLGGKETVGSMVVFENGAAKPAHYRHFKMRCADGKPDDYKSMKEVLMRRLKYLENEKEDKEIKIKMPTKKDFKAIKCIAERDFLIEAPLLRKDFLAAKKGKKLVGFGRILKLDEKVSVISRLWIAPAERGKKLGYKIMKKLIERSKLKRVYLYTKEELEEYYAMSGFTLLHESPVVLNNHVVRIKKMLKRKKMNLEIIQMVYDAKKLKPDPSFTEKPKLLVVDGGKGQLSTALLVLKRLRLKIPVIALAKRLEEIYILGQTAPLLLEEGDEALKLLKRIRDESHRFAIMHQRSLHRKTMMES